MKQVNALRFNWEESLNSRDPKLLVSNLPYQIASRLLVELSILKQSFDRMVLMFQKEVAQRILTDPGTCHYGFLTVIAKTFWNVHRVSEAGTVDFFPKPKVASQVLCFDRKKQISLNKASYKFYNKAIGSIHEDSGPQELELSLPAKKEAFINSFPLERLESSLHFSEFVKKAFLSRRKKLLPKLTDYAQKAKIHEIFKEMKLDERVRAENLTPKQFVELALSLKKR